MKAINYQTKKLNRFFYSSKGSPQDLQISRTCLKFYKKNVKYDKNQKLIHFFCEKPVSKPVNSQRTL